MNTIFVHDFRIDTRIGVYAWEAQLAQKVRLDLELGVPREAPFTSDDLADALDYAALVKRLQAFAANHPHRLLERFAQAIADIAMDEFHAPWVRVRVAKLGALPGVKEIGIEIERGRRS